MKIQEIDIKLIKPYWRNPRRNERTVAALKESIQKFGMNVPLVLDKENTIITGHARYKALLELGEKKAPCVVVDLPVKKAKEYRIADNKISELSQWEDDTLRAEARELQSIIGFQDEELQKLINEVSNAPDYSKLTDQDIGQAKIDLETRQTIHSEDLKSSLLKITCPHCTQEFSVNVNDLRKKGGWK